MPTSTPQKTKPRRTAPETGKQGSGDNLSPSTQTHRALAEAVRLRRKELGWPVNEAAAWCGVGTRFLLDLELCKKELQLDKVLQVAHGLGLEISITPRSAPSLGGSDLDGSGHGANLTTPLTRPAWAVIQSPEPIRHRMYWEALHLAGLHVARHSGISCLPAQVKRVGGRWMGVEVDIGAWGDEPLPTLAQCLGCSAASSKLEPWVSMVPVGVREEDGGPGLAAAFQYLNKYSSLPVQDVEQLLRWVILSYALKDTEHHLGRWRVFHSADGRHIRLAPLSALLCSSKSFEANPHKGFKIDRTWADLFMPHEHWKKLAVIAGVHPKVVFQIMREFSARVPGLLEQSLGQSLGDTPGSSHLVQVITEVRTACRRMGELAMAAANSGDKRSKVAGLKTVLQPKIKAVPTRLVIPEKKNLHIVNEDIFDND